MYEPECGEGADSRLLIIETMSPKEGDGLWRWSSGDYLRVMNELKKRKKCFHQEGFHNG